MPVCFDTTLTEWYNRRRHGYLGDTGLSKAFGDRVLFKNLNFRVESGQCLVVTGRNGSGKTTLLRIIAGLVRPTRGRVLICDENGVMDRSRLRRNLGIVAPDLVLYDELTALENLVLFARLRGLDGGPEAAKRTLERWACASALGIWWPLSHPE